MTWNCRFASVASLSTRRKQSQCQNSASDLSVSRWLNILNLNEYADVFEKFSTIDDVMKYTDRDLDDLGVKNDVHRFQMISSLIGTQAQCDRGSRSNGVSTAAVDRRQRHSLAVEPSVLANTHMQIRTFESTAASTTEISEPSKDSIDVQMELTDLTELTEPPPPPLPPPLQPPPPPSRYDYLDCCRTRSKKMLEWELSLDARDLRSHAWYHGSVSRTAAEQIVAHGDGDFLVRDCSSQPGNYVLTCRSKGQTLHFVINKMLLHADTVYESVQYRFEEDGFDTVPDLITYYVGNGKPVTTASDAKIRTPRNRQLPLSWRSGAGCCGHQDIVVDGSAEQKEKQKQEEDDDDDDDDDEKAEQVEEKGVVVAAAAMEDEGADEGPLPPPPKPSRSVGRPAGRNSASYTPLGGGGDGSGDSVHSACRAERVDRVPSKETLLRRRSSCGVVIKQAKYSPSPTPADRVGVLATSMPRLPSAFDPDDYHTLLLPVVENKPLDVDALRAVHALLLESDSCILANHMTRVDLRLTVANLGPEYDGCMCATGIELATLPHGRRHRADLIERTECLKLLVATTILTCDTDSERAELLNKWIQVAIDAKTALGNLYGFCAIMLGLCTPQVQRLDDTWHILRQKFTDSAFNFEAKLRSTFKSMNESTNPSAPNTTIPHLLPVLLLYERAFDQVAEEARLHWPSSLHATIEQWETSTPDLGLSTWYAHLDGSRHFCRTLPTFRRNAEIVLADSKVDELLLDTFRTEFHLKFLWGSRGATVAAAERHHKFHQILGVMSEKCESTMTTAIPAAAATITADGYS